MRQKVWPPLGLLPGHGWGQGLFQAAHSPCSVFLQSPCKHPQERQYPMCHPSCCECTASGRCFILRPVMISGPRAQPLPRMILELRSSEPAWATQPGSHLRNTSGHQGACLPGPQWPHVSHLQTSGKRKASCTVCSTWLKSGPQSNYCLLTCDPSLHKPGSRCFIWLCPCPLALRFYEFLVLCLSKY